VRHWLTGFEQNACSTRREASSGVVTGALGKVFRVDGKAVLMGAPKNEILPEDDTMKDRKAW